MLLHRDPRVHLHGVVLQCGSGRVPAANDRSDNGGRKSCSGAPTPPPPTLPGFPSYNAGRGSAGAQNCANQENGWWQYFQSIAREKTYRNSFVLWSHWGPSSLCSTPRDKKGLRQSVYFIHQGRESITCPQQLSSRSMMERKLILYTWG